MSYIYSAAFIPDGREFQRIGVNDNTTLTIDESVFPNEKFKFNGRLLRAGVNYVSMHLKRRSLSLKII